MAAVAAFVKPATFSMTARLGVRTRIALRGVLVLSFKPGLLYDVISPFTLRLSVRECSGTGLMVVACTARCHAERLFGVVWVSPTAASYAAGTSAESTPPASGTLVCVS